MQISLLQLGHPASVVTPEQDDRVSVGGVWGHLGSGTKVIVGLIICHIKNNVVVKGH